MLHCPGDRETGRNWEVAEWLSPGTLALVHSGWWPAGVSLQRLSRMAGGQPSSCKIKREKEFAAHI